MLNAKKAAKEMKNDNGLTGMCATCAHGDGCAMTHQGSINLYGCDEFEGLQLGAASVDYKEAMQVPPALGLCATCDHKNHCAHKTVPGGVWHCEEYL